MREGTGVARLEDDTGQRVKTALLHHWLVGMRGGERVLEAMAEIFPEADILTLVAERSALSDALRRRKILASWLDAIRSPAGSIPGCFRSTPPRSRISTCAATTS